MPISKIASWHCVNNTIRCFDVAWISAARMGRERGRREPTPPPTNTRTHFMLPMVCAGLFGHSSSLKLRPSSSSENIQRKNERQDRS